MAEQGLARDPLREAAMERPREVESAFSAARECLASLGSSLCAAEAAGRCEMAALRKEISRLRMELEASPELEIMSYCTGMDPGLSLESCVTAPPTPGTSDLHSCNKTPLPGTVALTPRRSTVASYAGEVEKKASVGSRCGPHFLQVTSPRSDSSCRSSRNRNREEAVSHHVSMLDLKTRIRHSISEPQAPSVTDRYFESGFCQAVTKSPYFEHLTLAVITCNALWIAIETDNNDADILVKAQVGFQIVEHAFCFFFSSELAVRFLALRQKYEAITDRWFVFDSVLVLLMILETWVMTAIFLVASAITASNTDEEGAFSGASDASILRIFRLLRLTRMARIARLLRYVPELMVIIRGIAAAMRSMAVTLTLLVLLIYVFAIVFTQLLMGSEPGSHYFASVPGSMLSLAFYGIILEGTPEVVKEVGQASFVCAALFFVFILTATFTVLNMLVGVMCETVRVVSATERERASLADAREKLLHLLRTSSLDADHNEMISREELKTLLHMPDACIVLRDLGIDVVSLVDTADIMFQDQEELDFSSFMDLVLQWRGCNKATVHDLVMQRKFVQQEFSQLHARIDQFLRQGRPYLIEPALEGRSAFLMEKIV